MNSSSQFPGERTVFFAGGQGKSGTTWVQLLLDAHPQISCRGEAHFFDLLAPAMHAAFAQYRQQLQDNNALFHELPGYPLPEQPQALAALRAALDSALAAQSRGMNVSAVGERTPANVEHLGLLWEVYPQARFIHVVRDPRDVAASLWHHGQRIQASEFKQRYGSIDGLALELCASWVSRMGDCTSLGDERAGQYLEVRYEDLLTDGRVALARILEFLDIPPDMPTIDSCLAATAFEKLSGGRAAGDEDRSSHFRKGISGDWRNHLQPDTCRQISVLAAEQFARLGYSPD